LRQVPKLVALLAVVAVALTGTAGLASAAPIPASAVTPAWGTFQSLAPTRVLDTRIAKGAPKAPVAPGATISLTMLGAGGVPTSGVSAVVLNVTVTAATKASYLTLWPAGITRPTASSINFVAGTDRANLVTVPLGTVGTGAGKISIFNQQGGVQVIADVMGYYMAADAPAAGGFYQSVMPARWLDSRDPSFGGPLAPGEAVSVPVSYIDNTDPANIIDPNPHIRALAVNITAVSPTKPGYLTAWDGGLTMPGTSTLNFAAGTITPNMAIVPVGPCVGCGAAAGLPSITVINESAGTVNLLVDVVGYYDDGQQVDVTGAPLGGQRFRPLPPTRIVDTRASLGTTTFTGAVTKSVNAPASVTGPDTWSLVTNTTAVLPTQATYLTVWPDLAFIGFPMPVVSNLNAAKGQSVANATITDLGFNNLTTLNPDAISIYNNRGAVNVLVDVVGTMDYPAPAAGPVAALARSAGVGPRTWTSNAPAQPVRQAAR
jgi:hypothetical protein